jgi:membrane-associated phospholipid phosphatase
MVSNRSILYLIQEVYPLYILIKYKEVKMNTFLASLILFVLCHVNISAQQSPLRSNSYFSSNIVQNFTSDISNFYNVGVDFFQSPLSFTTEDYYLTAIAISATAITTTLDFPAKRLVSRTKNSDMDKLMFQSEKVGNPRYGMALGGIFYLGGHLIRDKYIRETGQILMEAILLNGAVTYVLKLTIGRGRPNHESINGDFSVLEFEFDKGDQSMPSGHTSTAFTIATVLSSRINNIFASIALYSIAGLTAYERVYDNHHWISDTLLGAIIGYTVGKKVVDLYSELNEENKTQLSIYPYQYKSVYGIGFQIGF